MISVLIGVLIIVVVGAICFWAIDKFATDSRLANLLKLLVVLVCLGAIVQRVLARAEGKKQMIKPKRSAEQQVADELERRALHPLSSRQTISDSQAEPEFHANHKRLRAERLAREVVEIGLKAKGK